MIWMLCKKILALKNELKVYFGENILQTNDQMMYDCSSMA